MSRSLTFGLYFLATFLLAGAYGLTFMLPKLFAGFGADEKYVGTMLLVTTFTTLLSVYYAGHITDRLGRMNTLSLSGVLIAIGLFLFGLVEGKGITVATASAALGAGWGLMYSLTPVVLTRVTAESDRVRYFSLFSVFMMAGFGLSPVMASLLIEYGLTVSHAFIVSAVMCLIGGILFFLIKPSIRRMSASAGDEARSSLTLRGVGQVLSSRARTPVIMVWLGASVFAGMNNFQNRICRRTTTQLLRLLFSLYDYRCRLSDVAGAF